MYTHGHMRKQHPTGVPCTVSIVTTHRSCKRRLVALWRWLLMSVALLKSAPPGVGEHCAGDPFSVIYDRHAPRLDLRDRSNSDLAHTWRILFCSRAADYDSIFVALLLPKLLKHHTPSRFFSESQP